MARRKLIPYFLPLVMIFHREGSDELGMYAIRSSIVNFMFSFKADIADYLINTVIKLAKELKKKNKIIVPWTLSPMIRILDRRGFIEYNSKEMTPERFFSSC